jgi:hypothetical protein
MYSSIHYHAGVLSGSTLVFYAHCLTIANLYLSSMFVITIIMDLQLQSLPIRK